MTFKVAGLVDRITDEIGRPLSQFLYDGKRWLSGTVLDLRNTKSNKRYVCALLPLNEEARAELESGTAKSAAIEFNARREKIKIVLQGKAQVTNFDSFQCWTAIQLGQNPPQFLLMLDKQSANNLEVDMGKKVVEHSAFELVIWT